MSKFELGERVEHTNHGVGHVVALGIASVTIRLEGGRQIHCSEHCCKSYPDEQEILRRARFERAMSLARLDGRYDEDIIDRGEDGT